MTTLLPGLSLSSTSPSFEPLPAAQPAITRTQDLPAGSEYRFEVSFKGSLRIKLLSGTAELFGTELAPNSKDPYVFSDGIKAAIYTWHGCRLELDGQVESEYVAEETQMNGYANAHFALEAAREKAKQMGEGGPRVLIVGPENAGKTTLCKILTSYAVKRGRQPVVLNLDPRQGMLGVPGSLTAAAFSSIMDVEEGWGSAPISGPSATPVKMPLVYHFGLGSPEEAGGKIYRPLVTRMALAVTSRLEVDRKSREAGLIIDTPGAISHGKGGVYENIEHIVSEFSVNVVFVLGSERLFSDLTRKYTNRPNEDTVSIVRLDKSGGCVDRDEEYMKQLRQAQIRAYFFGHGENTLSPSTHWEDYSAMHIYKIVEGPSFNPLFQSGDEDDDDDLYQPSRTTIYESVPVSSMLQNVLLAVTNTDAKESQESIRDSSILGYVYVADVDEAKKRIRLLAPQPGQLPPNALIMGSFPEDVAGLVS